MRRRFLAGAQLGPERNLSDKGVEWQVTIIIVVAIEMAALLHPVNSVPHRVKVQHHLASALGQAARPHLRQAGLDLCRIMPNLVSGALSVVRQLQTIEGGRTGQGDAAMLGMHAIQPERILLVASHRQKLIQAQALMVVEVFVAQGQTIETLIQQLLDRMIDILLLAQVIKALSQTTG